MKGRWGSSAIFLPLGSLNSSFPKCFHLPRQVGEHPYTFGCARTGLKVALQHKEWQPATMPEVYHYVREFMELRLLNGEKTWPSSLQTGTQKRSGVGAGLQKHLVQSTEHRFRLLRRQSPEPLGQGSRFGLALPGE